MNKIKTDIYSGFLGAGKTTLIKKLVKEAYVGERVVLIENEFGEIGIDGGFLADAGITVNEMNSGCICCSLVGDFEKALEKVVEEYSPERIIIEPSGVGKLSDIIKAVESLSDERIVLNATLAVVDAKKCKMYMKNFGEFFNDQIESATAIVLSHTAGLSKEKLDEALALIKEHNSTAVIVATEWEELSGKAILDAVENKNTITEELEKLEEELKKSACPVCGHHHGEHHHEEHECGCGHHHGEHHHEEHECGCGHHHGEHHHEEHECSCGHHHGEHHHADEVFVSCGFETKHRFSEEELANILSSLENESEYGIVLRAKGIVESSDTGAWIHFDYVPSEPDIRRGQAAIIGRICVIGSGICEDKIRELFGL